MDTEIEAKFTDINAGGLRKKLRDLGAVLVHLEVLMRRKVCHHPTNKQNDWFRVRDEGNGKITLSYKKVNDRTLHGTQEISYVVPDFDQACRFLQGAQLKFTSYQETRREAWRLDDVDITIDTWPWIPTFVELEAPTEKAVRAVATKLGFDFAKALHGSVENVYQQHYDVTEKDVDSWPEITFVPVPEWLEKKRIKK